MLWRVRTTLSDRPGALAALAKSCGDHDVNILGLQIFPGIEGVTDELVLRAPEDWERGDVVRLTERAGGREVAVAPCTAHALVDGPTRYLNALRHVLDEPGLAGEVLCGLFAAERVEPSAPAEDGDHRLSVTMGDQVVALRRETPFTPTEQGRASVLAELVGDLVGSARPTPAGVQRMPATGPIPGEPVLRAASLADAEALAAMVQRCSVETTYRRFDTPLAGLSLRSARRLLSGHAVAAEVSGDVVGLATVDLDEHGVAEVGIIVEDAWQRRGIGTRLLSLAARVARSRGAAEIVVRTRPDNPAVLRLVLATGLCGRVRYVGEHVMVTANVRDVKPLAAGVETGAVVETAPA